MGSPHFNKEVSVFMPTAPRQPWDCSSSSLQLHVSRIDMQSSCICHLERIRLAYCDTHQCPFVLGARHGSSSDLEILCTLGWDYIREKQLLFLMVQDTYSPPLDLIMEDSWLQGALMSPKSGICLPCSCQSLILCKPHLCTLLWLLRHDKENICAFSGVYL